MSEQKDIDWYNLAGLGIIGGLACIYVAYILDAVLGVTYFAFLGALGAILATVWGADAVRRICKFGIGTGVPSIGMLAFGMGLLSTLLGLKVGDYLFAHGLSTAVSNIVIAQLIGPVVALIVSLIMGAIVGYIAQNVIKMKIPTMQVGMTMIAGAACMIYLGYIMAITGGAFDYTNVILKVMNTGFIAPLFIVGALPMLHAFNACMGPDEFQKRTLTLAIEASSMSVVIFGILSFASSKIIPPVAAAAQGVASTPPVGINVALLGVTTGNLSSQAMITSVLTVVFGLIVWAYAYLAYWRKVKESGVTIMATGLIPKKEE
ncbi:MAG TPA: tetrahydromethanopterin S-methyltransferase subunit C [Methanocella sp.]|nr:tetrahydromethanopterin S-methyltransferase subunit C [Methanocella sp.]